MLYNISIAILGWLCLASNFYLEYLMSFETRKKNRLKNYDYSNKGAYFITICTTNRSNILWGQTKYERNSMAHFSRIGLLVDRYIKQISQIYQNVEIDRYVIMPDHIHMIILITKSGRSMIAPTDYTSIHQIIKQFKGIVSKEAGMSIWQKSFFDHIIRDENEYYEISKYIINNPKKYQ